MYPGLPPDPTLLWKVIDDDVHPGDFWSFTVQAPGCASALGLCFRLQTRGENPSSHGLPGMGFLLALLWLKHQDPSKGQVPHKLPKVSRVLYWSSWSYIH